MTYAISGASCLGDYGAGGAAQLYQLASRARRGLGAITPPGYSDIQAGYPIDESIYYTQDVLFEPSMMDNAFVPSGDQIEILGPTKSLEDSEFKDVGEQVDDGEATASAAKGFSTMMVVGLAVLGFFFLRDKF